MRMTRFRRTGFRTIVTLLLTGLFALSLVVGGAMPAQAGNGSFSNTGSMNAARDGQTATLLKNGQVLVTGGDNYTTGFLASAELYNPATGKWTLTGSMSIPRISHDTVLLQNGEALVAGGYNGSTPGMCNNQASAELYNPATGAWTVTGSLATARYSFALIVLGNGEALAAGGASCSASYLGLTSAELYNPATGTWTAAGNMPTATQNDGAVRLSNGDVLVDGENLYDPSTGTWTALSPAEPQGLTLPNGTIWTNTAINGGTIYDPTTGQSISYPPPSCMTTTQTCNANVSLLDTGNVLIAGGTTKVNAQPYPITETNGNAAVFNPSTLTWASTTSMKQGAIGTSVTALPQGQVLFAGGEAYDKSAGALRPIAGAELYTP